MQQASIGRQAFGLTFEPGRHQSGHGASHDDSALQADQASHLGLAVV